MEAMSAKFLRKLWADPGGVRAKAGRAGTCWLGSGVFVTEAGEAGSRTWGTLQKERLLKPSKEALTDTIQTGSQLSFGDSFQLLGGEATREHLLHLGAGV